MFLQELAVNETDLSFMSPEYQNILENAENLKLEFKRQPCHLERLYGDDYFLYLFEANIIIQHLILCFIVLNHSEDDREIENFQF